MPQRNFSRLLLQLQSPDLKELVIRSFLLCVNVKLFHRTCKMRMVYHGIQARYKNIYILYFSYPLPMIQELCSGLQAFSYFSVQSVVHLLANIYVQPVPVARKFGDKLLSVIAAKSVNLNEVNDQKKEMNRSCNNICCINRKLICT